MNVCIIDYNLGNIKSIQSMLSQLDIYSFISSNRTKIKNSDIILLPGVGTFGSAMKFLKLKKLDKFIIDQYKKKKPIIGICLGMQLFFEKSYENGNHKGLGLIKGVLKKNLHSHIGWNNLIPISKDFYKIKNKYFYFNHSYSVKSLKKNQSYFSNYENKIISLIKTNNFVGMQFHPEKSQKNGLELMRSIIESLKYA
jgi:glutamine amidotransferase